MNSDRRAVSVHEVTSALGNVAVPGDLDEFVGALSQRHPSVVRRRREVAAEDLPFPTSPVDWYPLGHRQTSEAPRASRCLDYSAGDYYLQDAASLLPLAVVGADTDSLRGRLICDLCAAPGGKATALVEAVDSGEGDDNGFVLANEVIRSRLGALRLNLARTGSDRYAVSSLDPERLAQRLPGVFDVVVVDAPCSGQSLLARGKQKTSSLSAAQIAHSADRQHRIVDAAVRLLRDGGELVYSTCTFAEAENEVQVHRLCAAGIATPRWVDHLAIYESSRGCYRLWPHQHRCAGSFAASMVVSHSDAIPQRRRLRGRENHRCPFDLRSWYDVEPETTRVVVSDSVVFGWPAGAPDWIDQVAIGGPEIAHCAGRTWKPAHAGALRRGTRLRPLDSVDIDGETAKALLRGEPIACDERGWKSVRWRGRPLGWIKGDGKTGKNHLPRSARVSGVLEHP